MAERHSFWPPGLRAVAARRSKALSSSAPPCQISPHAPTRPGSACRNDAGMMGGCGEHASGTAAHSQGRSRLSREGRGSGGGCERVEERGARARAWESRFIFHHWYKRDPKRHSRRAHARSYHLNTHTARLNEAPDGRAGPAVELLGGDGSLRRSMRSCEEAHFRLVSAPATASITWNRRRDESQQRANRACGAPLR